MGKEAFKVINPKHGRRKKGTLKHPKINTMTQHIATIPSYSITKATRHRLLLSHKHTKKKDRWYTGKGSDLVLTNLPQKF